MMAGLQFCHVSVKGVDEWPPANAKLASVSAAYRGMEAGSLCSAFQEVRLGLPFLAQ